MAQYSSLQPRVIDSRDPEARAARVRGAQFDMSGNLVGGKDQMTGAPVAPRPPVSLLDQAGKRLGWNQPSRYQNAVANAQPKVPVATAANAATAKAANMMPVQGVQTPKPAPASAPAAPPAAQNPASVAPSPVPAKPAGEAPVAPAGPGPMDWMNHAMQMVGQTVNHFGRFISSFGGGGNGSAVPGAAPDAPRSAAPPEPSAAISAPYDPAAAMAGRFRNAAWTGPGQEVTQDGAGSSVEGKDGRRLMVQPTGAMAMDAWQQRAGVQNLSRAERPGQPYSELGQAVMQRTQPVENGEYVKDDNGQRVSEGYRQEGVAQSFAGTVGRDPVDGHDVRQTDRFGNAQTVGTTRGNAYAGGRAIAGAYGTGSARFNVPDKAPGAIYDETGLVSQHQPASQAVAQTPTTPLPKLAGPDADELDETGKPRRRGGFRDAYA